MRKFNISVNGVSYEVEVEEIKEGVAVSPRPAAPVAAPKPAAAAKPAPSAPGEAPDGATTVTAPMPGNIWKVLVKEGEAVKQGQVLIILEAMKMENEIMAPADGAVASLYVKEGVAVNGGDLLVALK
ncbi:biotin/lipoyl-containing protein [Alkaliphilus crotonatoxidans]